MADSTSFSSSSSSSTPTVLQTPQSEWSLQLSQLLTALGQNQYSWAMEQFARGQGITDQNIAQFMEMSGKGAGLAQTLIQQYQDQFAPLIQQYINQANSYNSEDRQRFEAGRAESRVAQASTAARNEMERKLQGWGINPSSGRYQDLIATLRMQDAASRAGAGTEAALNTADRGRAMLEKGVQFGQNVPGMAVNALNSAYTGIAGAQNANLGQQNTGANLTSSAAPFLSAAGGAIKMPAVGQTSTGMSTSQQRGGNDPNSNANKSIAAGQQPGKGMYSDPMHPTTDTQRNSGANGPAATMGRVGAPASGTMGGSNIKQIGDQGEWSQPGGPGASENEVLDTQQNWMSGEDDPAYQAPDYDNTYGDFDPAPENYSEDPGYDFQAQDPSADAGLTNNNTYDDTYDNTSSSDQYDSFTPPDGQSSYGWMDASDPNYYDDASSGFDSGFDDSYAGGGRVGRGVLPTSGGAVPRSASPSRGKQTDDISARLNANEYVIPRDVAMHKGPKFFDNLIAESRRARTGMAGPAPGAKMRPPLRSKPAFVSRGVV